MNLSAVRVLAGPLGVHELLNRACRPRADRRLLNVVHCVCGRQNPRTALWGTSNNSVHPIQHGYHCVRVQPTSTRLSVSTYVRRVAISREKDGSVPATWGGRLEGDDPSRVDPVGESGHVRRIESYSRPLIGPLTNSGRINRSSTLTVRGSVGLLRILDPVRNLGRITKTVSKVLTLRVSRV